MSNTLNWLILAYSTKKISDHIDLLVLYLGQVGYNMYKVIFLLVSITVTCYSDAITDLSKEKSLYGIEVLNLDHEILFTMMN